MTQKSKCIVYWMEGDIFTGCQVRDVAEMLSVSERLRKMRREGQDITNITSSCEFDDMVGEHGVDVTGPDYDWKKRR